MRGALGTDRAVRPRTSVVLLDLNVAVNRLHVFGLTRDGRGLVRRFLGSGAAGGEQGCGAACRAHRHRQLSRKELLAWKSSMRTSRFAGWPARPGLRGVCALPHGLAQFSPVRSDA